MCLFLLLFLCPICHWPLAGIQSWAFVLGQPSGLLHTEGTAQEFLYCCHSRRLALRDQKCSLAHQNLPPWVSNSGSTALPGCAMDCEQLSKLSWLCFATQVTQLVLYISEQSIAKADLPCLPYLQDYGMISCPHFQPDVGNLLHFSLFTLTQPVLLQGTVSLVFTCKVSGRGEPLPSRVIKSKDTTSGCLWAPNSWRLVKNFGKHHYYMSTLLFVEQAPKQS